MRASESLFFVDCATTLTWMRIARTAEVPVRSEKIVFLNVSLSFWRRLMRARVCVCVPAKVREATQRIVDLLNDRDKLGEARKQASENRVRGVHDEVLSD